MGRVRPEAVKFARWIGVIFACFLLPDAVTQDNVIRVNVQLVRLLVTVQERRRGSGGNALEKRLFRI